MTKKPRHLHVYTDRHGHERIYLRKAGEKRVPLPGPLFSYQFWEAYHRAAQGVVAAIRTSADPEERNPPGSVSTAIAGYYGSAEFKQLADSSRSNRRRILERFRKEHGAKSLAKLETKHINAIIDKKADKPAAANELRKLLHIVFEYAIGAGLITENPIKRAKRVKYVKRSHRAWTDADVEAYRERWPEGSPQRLGLELFIHTGLRRSDAVRLGWDHVKEGWITITTVKSRHKKTLNVPIHPTLWHHIKDTPRNQRTFLRTKWDKDRSAKGATNWIRSAAHEAGLPSDSSPHGLRHAICVRLAEAGCTPHQIQAITGHDNLAEIETYTKAVSQKRLAQIAMDSLATPKTGLANFDANALKLLEALALPSGIEPLSPP
ncbi:integrase [Bradyrhizobium japonicum]|uniref:Integrase n=1 Tax=Bradyrhizobium japonicum TaxID=375 RepID=A0ABV2RYM0_BRAJP